MLVKEKGVTRVKMWAAVLGYYIFFAYNAKSTYPICPFLFQLTEDSIASDEKRDELFHTLLDGSTNLTQRLALFELLKVWPQLRSSIGQ